MKSIIETLGANIVQALLEPATPATQGFCIVFAERIKALVVQAAALRQFQQIALRRQHAPGKDILLDEIRVLAVGLEAFVIYSDHLDNRVAAWLEQVAQLIEVGVPVAFAHGLEHFNGYDVIEAFIDVAVITQFKTCLLGQASAVNAFLGVAELLPRESDTVNRYPLARRELSETTPAATYLEDGLSWPGAGEFEYPSVLLRLGLLQIAAIPVGKAGAGVGHGWIEPEPVEIVSEIVMRLNVSLAPLAGV